MKKKRKIWWLFWPFKAIWNLLASLVALTGRFVAIALGLMLMIAGVAISLTVVGAVVGVPLFVAGALLVIRGLW